MGQIGFKCVNTKENISYDACIACAKEGGKPHGGCDYTPEILMLMKQLSMPQSVDYVLKARRLSVSTLLSETRQGILKLFFDYYVSPERMFAAMRGTMIHAAIAGVYRSDAWKELPFQRALPFPIDGEEWLVSGRLDVAIPSAKTIIDYKSTKAVPRYGKPYGHHAEQLNVYRWLYEPVFGLAEKLRVVYVDSMQAKRIRIPLDDVNQVAERLQASAVDFVKHLKSRIAPDGKYSSSNWACKYCDVSDICKTVKGGQEI